MIEDHVRDVNKKPMKERLEYIAIIQEWTSNSDYKKILKFIEAYYDKVYNDIGSDD